ncbi:uncharacterized protein LOC116841034 [Odontomachus brunneus]|uniref:uncharacterized protein LOC116841034 n=1 Tax=Odontomachus brunneus TaxID=486640 RepID=UPI0013F292E0|nr:uncharacterized protein LOC116841034 [Odontomachus brunneus]
MSPSSVPPFLAQRLTRQTQLLRLDWSRCASRLATRLPMTVNAVRCGKSARLQVIGGATLTPACHSFGRVPFQRRAGGICRKSSEVVLIRNNSSCRRKRLSNGGSNGKTKETDRCIAQI